jgi:hypothetical protein
MRTSTFTPEQMVQSSGKGTEACRWSSLCRQHGISEQTIYGPPLAGKRHPVNGSVKDFGRTCPCRAEAYGRNSGTHRAPTAFGQRGGPRSRFGAAGSLAPRISPASTCRCQAPASREVAKIASEHKEPLRHRDVDRKGRETPRPSTSTGKGAACGA